MQYRELTPHPRLRPFVEAYWSLREANGRPEPQRIVADGCMEVILNLGEPFRCLGEDGKWRRQPQCFVTGQITRPLLVEPSRNADVLGIRLTPSGARALLEVPCGELTNRWEEMSGVAPRLARALEAVAKVTPSRRITALEAALMQHAGRQPDARVGAAVELIRRRRGNLPVDELSSATGLGARQLQRRFQDSVGVGPKLLARMTRLQAALRAAERRSEAPWAALAQECGYCDQSHLIRDFRQFAGQPPETLLRDDSDWARYFSVAASRAA